jgi:hypothetical protein
VLQGQVNVDLALDLVLDLAVLTCTVDALWIGGTCTAGALVPFGNARLDAWLRGPMGGTVGVSESAFDLSGVALIPL